MRTSCVLILAAFSIGLFGTVQAEQNIGWEDQVDKLVKQLEQKIPDGPSFIESKETVELMQKCAETKRIDCAYLLIKSLAFSYDPWQSNETLSKAQMLPAISIMRDYFGDSMAPLLFAEAIQTKLPWLRSRIAFATKEICSAKTINEMKLIFSLEETKNKNAHIFLDLLSMDDIDVELDLPHEIKFQKMEDAVKQ